jgi:hypothetical protein
MGFKESELYADFKMGLFMFVSTSYKKLEQKRFLGTSLKIEFFGYNF